jgi:hypothetical protein
MNEPNESKGTAAATAAANSPLLSQVFPGLGIGLLVGLIVGMSVSPVVSIILGSLASLLAAFLGLQGGGESEAADETLFRRFRMNGLRMGSFGFACVAGILLGLFIRSQDVFSLPINKQVEKWTSAGYSDKEARQFVAFEKLGVKPDAKEIVASEIQKAHSSSLFTGASSENLCYELRSDRYDNDIKKILEAYRNTNKNLAALANDIEKNVPREQQLAFINSVWRVICELEEQRQ